MQDPQPPAPEIMAIGEGQQALAGVVADMAQSLDQLMQGHQQSMEVLGALLKAARAKRVRVPTRDASGDIVQVDESIVEDEA